MTEADVTEADVSERDTTHAATAGGSSPLRAMSSSEGPKRASRVIGIDVARGLASLIMVQGHAYDGWVRAEEKTSAAYLFTRVLGSLPLPSFLVLAGAAMVLRVEAADAKRELVSDVRRGLVRRGLVVLAVGYLVNALSALIDGYEGPETFFRADVLQLIGLSIASVALFGVHARVDDPHRVDRRRLSWVAALVATLPVLLAVPITRWSLGVDAPLGYLVGLFADVPPVTRMPYVPLASWCGVGVAAGLFLTHANRDARARAGAPTRVLVGLLAGALVTVVVFSHLTTLWVAASGVPLSRAHPAVIANAIELAARGLVVVAVGALATHVLPRRIEGVLATVGRGSLVAYVFHVPFCYGALGRPFAGRLTMVEATVGVVALELASIAAVYARDALRRRTAER